MSPPQSPSLRAQNQGTRSDGASDDSATSEARRSRRRHSGGGLLRRPFAIDSDKRSSLEFHEEEGYGGDGEDEVFVMDDEARLASPRDAMRSPLSQELSPPSYAPHTTLAMLSSALEERGQRTQTYE
jgi:hypothetical protein